MSSVIPRPPLPPGPYLVVGLARSGIAAALALRTAGAFVAGTDTRAIGADDAENLAAAGVVLHPAGDGLPALTGARTVVKSPGVPQTAPVIRAARERGLRVVGELEIGWRLLPNPFVARVA